MADEITIEECITRLEIIRHEIVPNSRYHFALSAGIAALYELEKDTPAVNRWIPVDDSLPEENRYVLAWAKRANKSRVIISVLINGTWKIGVNDCSDWFHVQGEITHWMPMPEPPEAGESNDKSNSEKS